MKHFGLAFVLALAACSMQPPTGPIAGKAYFAQVGCLSCHRVGVDGSATGTDLTLVGFRHSAKWLDIWLDDPAAWKPGTTMPKPRLSAAARAAIVSYLTTLQGQDWPKAGKPWNAANGDAAKGRLIYLHAGCIACHGVDGTGDSPNNNVAGAKIPPLTNASETFTKAELVAKIKNGSVPTKSDPVGPDPLIRMPAWKNVLDDAELDAVAAYLLTLKPQKIEKTDW